MTLVCLWHLFSPSDGIQCLRADATDLSLLPVRCVQRAALPGALPSCFFPEPAPLQRIRLCLIAGLRIDPFTDSQQ